MALLDGRGNPIANGHGTALLEAQMEALTATLADTQRAHHYDVDTLRETITELELALEDVGWMRLRATTSQEFTRAGLDKIIDNARTMFLKNPLIKRAVNVQTYYVMGQGFQVQARDEQVDDVVQAFWNDPKNRYVLGSHTAREMNEQTLQTDGNLFFALFTKPSTGRVIARRIDVGEMRDVVCNPEDAGEPWYYERQWTERPFDIATGKLAIQGETKKAYYPDWRIMWSGPIDELGTARKKHPPKIGDIEVRTDVAILHVKAGGLAHMRLGVPDVYAALDWARAYTKFLENWHSIVQSLSRFAWSLTTKGSRISPAQQQLNSRITADSVLDTNPPPLTGAAFVSDDDAKLTPIPKTGATISAEDGRMLRTMVASAVDLPDTILGSDPDMGNLATAKTLDRPTELGMRSRQMLWQDVIRDLMCYVIGAAARAPLSHEIEGTADDAEPWGVLLTDDPETGEPRDPAVDIAFPPILEQDREAIITAIVNAATLGGHPAVGSLPPDLVTRLLLVTLEVENVDELVEELYPPTDSDDPQQAATERAQMTRAMKDLKEALVTIEAERKQLVGAS